MNCQTIRDNSRSSNGDPRDARTWEKIFPGVFFNLSDDKIMYSWCTPGLEYRYSIFLCSLDVEISSQIAIDQYKDYLVGQLTTLVLVIGNLRSFHL